MTKRYDEPIEVTMDRTDEVAPLSFRWRGRTYQVDRPLENWSEAAVGNGSRGRRDREYVRVLAHPAGTYATGEIDADGFLRRVSAVYDLCFDRVRGGWHLARIWD